MKTSGFAGIFRNGARGTRTPDLLGAIQALSQLSYSPAHGPRGRWPWGKCRASRKSAPGGPLEYGDAMGLLDDAIREHLELRRRHGADPGEVVSKEHEALGPAAIRAADVLPTGADDNARLAAEPPTDRRRPAASAAGGWSDLRQRVSQRGDGRAGHASGSGGGREHRSRPRRPRRHAVDDERHPGSSAALNHTTNGVSARPRGWPLRPDPRRGFAPILRPVPAIAFRDSRRSTLGCLARGGFRFGSFDAFARGRFGARGFLLLVRHHRGGGGFHTGGGRLHRLLG